MYHVNEHRYYIKDMAAPILEYCVCEAEVTRFFESKYVELVGLSPEGHRTPYLYKLSDVGKSLFYTAKEAALLAERMTRQYENTWGWLGAPDIPMRRTWKKYLDDENAVKQISADEL